MCFLEVSADPDLATILNTNLCPFRPRTGSGMVACIRNGLTAAGAEGSLPGHIAKSIDGVSPKARTSLRLALAALVREGGGARGQVCACVSVDTCSISHAGCVCVCSPAAMGVV